MKTDNSIVLMSSKLPKMLGELTHSNQFLKVFSLAALGVTACTLIVMAFLVNRPPLVLTLAPDATAMIATEMPSAEEQVRAAITRYLEKRYNWGPDTVVQRLKEAQAFVLPQGVKAFQSAVSGITRFSTEKRVSQRTYPAKVQIDLAQRTAFITGDRVTSIQGLKAAGDLKLALSFDGGPRSAENPWGLYITKEREE